MQFCRKCGRSLLNSPERCPSCGTPIRSTLKKPKVIVPAKVYTVNIIQPKHVSTEEDVITNPKDYQHQTFPFDLHCPYEHNWPAGTRIPVSNGKPYCPECGERLKTPRQPKK